MPAPALSFGPHSPFSEEERLTMLRVREALADAPQPAGSEIAEALARHVERVEGVAAALRAFPPVFRESALGRRRRDLDTLVELHAGASDADLDMVLPTRALVGRALLMARMNAWRLLDYATGEAVPAEHPARPLLRREVDRWLHRCVFSKLAEEVLSALSMDRALARPVRRAAVGHLVSIWDGAPSPEVRAFFPFLEAVWSARRQLRVNLGTMLGFSEMMMLLQAGCDPQFVQYFAQARRIADEQQAFQEFLVGVTTEQIHSLEQLMQRTGRTSITREEADLALGRTPDAGTPRAHPGVRAYHFYRERYLQAAARRLRDLPGPRHTAEEYMMIYFLEREGRRGDRGGGNAGA
jgi:hypothetical protein